MTHNCQVEGCPEDCTGEIIELKAIFTAPPTKTIKECMHETTKGVGLGYALCGDCGALLPDEDPDLYAKCSIVNNSI